MGEAKKGKSLLPMLVVLADERQGKLLPAFILF
jgi:hypothetical protein